jgi:uncharacterized protein YndB with AHSA1/START domain
MKTITNTFRVSINAKPEAVFAYVSDLTRHGEWNSGLRIEAVTSGPASVGSQYRSVGKAFNQDRPNELRVTGYQPPTRFAFVAHDPNFKDITHEFIVSPQDGGTLLERTVTAHMPPHIEFVWRLVIWPLIDRPGMNKSMAALKAQLERPIT